MTSLMQVRTLVRVAAIAWLAMGCSDPIRPSASFQLVCDIDSDLIFNGGPGRDGIPALDLPDLVPATNASFMSDTMRVLGVEIAGAARAYPLWIMWWHEVVNDTLGGAAVAVTYCPLTGSGLTFDAGVNGTERRFGVSGLLFENNLMMFDRQTESLWNQLLMGSQCGPERGAGLVRLPVVETTWGHWRTSFPQSTVLTSDTGYDRPYGEYPYGDYAELTNRRTLFPSSPWSTARLPKELVLGVREGADASAYPFGVLADLGAAVAVNDDVGGRPIVVTYIARHGAARAFDRRVDGKTLTFSVSDSTVLALTDAETGTTWNALGEAIEGPLTGRRLESLADTWTLFWFAWSVFYPETELLE